MGYVVARIAGFKIIEGVGRFGGFWFVKKPNGKVIRCDSRTEAEVTIDAILEN